MCGMEYRSRGCRKLAIYLTHCKAEARLRQCSCLFRLSVCLSVSLSRLGSARRWLSLLFPGDNASQAATEAAPARGDVPRGASCTSQRAKAKATCNQLEAMKAKLLPKFAPRAAADKPARVGVGNSSRLGSTKKPQNPDTTIINWMRL